MKKIVIFCAMAILCLPQLLHAQGRQITGTVTDERSAPLPLVSVVEKGTTNGTTTNASGAFKPYTGF